MPAVRWKQQNPPTQAWLQALRHHLMHPLRFHFRGVFHPDPAAAECSVSARLPAGPKPTLHRATTYVIRTRRKIAASAKDVSRRKFQVLRFILSDFPPCDSVTILHAPKYVFVATFHNMADQDTNESSALGRRLPLSTSGPLECSLKGTVLMNRAYFNKGSAFTKEERKEFELSGLLPPGIQTLEQQVRRAYEQYSTRPDDLAKNTFLTSMKEQNEVLYFKVRPSPELRARIRGGHDLTMAAPARPPR